MLSQRGSGILLHPTCLPGPFGAGDFGADAYRFVDWLASSGQTYWQMLPLGAIGPGNSPYMSSSAFAGNVLLIDLVALKEQGWLGEGDLQPRPAFRDDSVDFTAVKAFRLSRLRRAAQAFFAAADQSSLASYQQFCATESTWLDDYAMFMTIKQQYHGSAWNHWPADLRSRNALSLQRISSNSAVELGYWKFFQWCFATQWLRLIQYAQLQGVRVIGDVPIFVAYQSADVWAHQELFQLDAQGNPLVVAGVPPDYFSATGQRWGNPLYRWEAHAATGYAWWIARLRHMLKQFDLLRIDHFRGFTSHWEIAAEADSAVHGRWMPGPGSNLFEALQQALGGLPFIAEDLGIISAEVVELREKFNLPGMRILQFAFAEDENHYFLPHRYVPNCVAYTGTHDNDTSLGWWNNASAHERGFAQHYLGSDGHDIVWRMLQAVSASAANTVIFPLQDVLCLSSEHRMNFPGVQTGNWAWRFMWEQLRPEQSAALAKLSKDNQRMPSEYS